MSSITFMDEHLLKLIYTHLKLRDRFNFALTNKKLNRIFSDYPFSDLIYLVKRDQHLRGDFVFKNIVRIQFNTLNVDYRRINNFQNLRQLDLSRTKSFFENWREAKEFVDHVPSSVSLILVTKDMEEQLKLAVQVSERRIIIKIVESKKRVLSEPLQNQVVKRLRTPSPLRESIDEELESILLFKSRIKYG